MGKYSDFRISSFQVEDAWRMHDEKKKTMWFIGIEVE